MFPFFWRRQAAFPSWGCVSVRQPCVSLFAPDILGHAYGLGINTHARPWPGKPMVMDSVLAISWSAGFRLLWQYWGVVGIGLVSDHETPKTSSFTARHCVLSIICDFHK
jgi:hypothetical protein